MQKIIKDYNHNLSKKLLEKLSYEAEYQDEVENFDLSRYLFEESKWQPHMSKC